MEIVNAEIINEFRELKQGDHLVAIGDKNCQHGIFIGTSEGVVNFGTEDVDRTDVSEKVDLLQFAKYTEKRLVRITYESEKCIDPSKTLFNALNKDFFDLNESGPQKAIRCKIGKSATQQTLNSLESGTRSLMVGQTRLEKMRKLKDDVLWFFK